MTEFYIVSVKHTLKRDEFITLWRPENKGYCWPLSWAGIYSREAVMKDLEYYNSGADSIAVPKEIMDELATPVPENKVDGNAGPVVLNNRNNWDTIIRKLPIKPEFEVKPTLYRNGRR